MHSVDGCQCRYLHQYSKSIADAIGSNTSTVILTTLQFTDVTSQPTSHRTVCGLFALVDSMYLYW